MAEINKALKIQLGDEVEALVKELNITDINEKSKTLIRSKIKDKLPEGYKIDSLGKFFERRKSNPKATLTISPVGTSKGQVVRQQAELRPGMKSTKATDKATILTRNNATKQLVDLLTGDPELGGLAYDPVVVEKYLFELDNDIRAIVNEVRRYNKTVPKDKRISLGHLNPVSKSIHSPRNMFFELLKENVAKGDNYSENQAAMRGLGNFSDPKKSWLQNWRDDFLVWADKPENGGSGVLPQKGDLSGELKEQLRTLTGNQFDQLDEVGKQKAFNKVQDYLGQIEGRNQWTVGQSKNLQDWGVLTEDQVTQAKEFIDDSELAGIRKGERLNPEVTELGPKLGGAGSDIKVPLHKQNVLKSTASDILNFTKKVVKHPVTRRVALGAGAALPLVSIPFSAQAAEDRELEAKQNPDDKLLQFQATLDRTTYELDKQALAAWQSTELLTAGVAEAGSVTTGIFSGLLDLGKWSQKVSPIPKGYEYYPGGKGIPRKIKQ